MDFKEACWLHIAVGLIGVLDIVHHLPTFSFKLGLLYSLMEMEEVGLLEGGSVRH